MFTFIFNLYSRMSIDLSLGDLVDGENVIIFYAQNHHQQPQNEGR